MQSGGPMKVGGLSARVPAFVRTDQSRFRQALINLINNAIKFTESGRVTVRIKYRGQIATFRVPRYVRFVDEWPMSATKIQKVRLRERIATELAGGDPAG